MNTLRDEEKKKMDVWTEAMAKVGSEEESDFDLIKRILRNNSSIPTLVVDANHRVQYARNPDSRMISTQEKIDSTLTSMRAGFDPIPINLSGLEQKVYYGKSSLVLNLERRLDEQVHFFLNEVVLKTHSVSLLIPAPAGEELIHFANIDPAELDMKEKVAARVAAMSSEKEPIPLRFGGEVVNIIYHTKRAGRTVPLFQFSVIFLFLLFSIFVFTRLRGVA